MVNDDGELATMRGGYTVIPGGGEGCDVPMGLQRIACDDEKQYKCTLYILRGWYTVMSRRRVWDYQEWSMMIESWIH